MEDLFSELHDLVKTATGISLGNPGLTGAAVSTSDEPPFPKKQARRTARLSPEILEVYSNAGYLMETAVKTQEMFEVYEAVVVALHEMATEVDSDELFAAIDALEPSEDQPLQVDFTDKNLGAQFCISVAFCCIFVIICSIPGQIASSCRWRRSVRRQSSLAGSSPTFRWRCNSRRCPATSR